MNSLTLIDVTSYLVRRETLAILSAIRKTPLSFSEIVRLTGLKEEEAGRWLEEMRMRTLVGYEEKTVDKKTTEGFFGLTQEAKHSLKQTCTWRS